MKFYGKEMKTDIMDGYKALTWEDAEKMGALNEECGWGFNAWDCLRFIADHAEANCDIKDGKHVTEATRRMEAIEYRLDDANFHKFADALRTRNYNTALQMVQDDFADYFKEWSDD